MGKKDYLTYGKTSAKETEKSWIEKHPDAYSYLVIGGTFAACVVVSVASLDFLAWAVAHRLKKAM